MCCGLTRQRRWHCGSVRICRIVQWHDCIWQCWRHFSSSWSLLESCRCGSGNGGFGSQSSCCSRGFFCFRVLVAWSLGRNSPLQLCLLEVNSRSCVLTLRRRWPPCVLCGQEQHSKRWCGVSCSWSSHARIAICWWRGSTDGVWCLHGHWGPCQPCGWCVQHRVLDSTRDRGGWEDTGRQQDGR